MKLPFNNPIPPQVRFGIAAAWAGWRGVVVAVLIALLIVQTVRIDGLRFWPFAIEGLAAKVERLEGDKARLIAAQALAVLSSTGHGLLADAQGFCIASRGFDAAASEFLAAVSAARRRPRSSTMWCRSVARSFPASRSASASRFASARGTLGAAGGPLERL